MAEQLDSGGKTRKPSWAQRHSGLFALISVLLLAVVSVLVGWVVSQNGTYPGGVDTLCHIYKGDVLYNSIQEGEWWPLYDPLWYNGVQMMRYWAPLPVYVFAACEAIAGGDPLHGFVVFCSLVFFLGALSWLFVGIKLKRPMLGLFVGVLWFFLPNNLIALFHEGNLPRCLCLAMLPMLIYLVSRYLQGASWKSLAPVTPLFALMVLCHSGFAGMILIAMIVYLVCHGIIVREWSRVFAIVASMVLGYVIVGLWLVPSLIGGITSTNSDQIMQGFFQSLVVTLNPLERLQTGNTKFYYGAAAMLVTVLGIVCAKRRSMPLFWTALVIILCTSEAMYPVLSKLPGGQYLWMLRFVSIALALMLMGFMSWRTLKTPLVVLMCALLVLDAVPSWQLVYGNQDGSEPAERLQADAEYMLVDRAKEITTQRLALVDESHLDSESAYVVTGLGDRIAMAEGAAWQSAVTATNFKQLDRALEQGRFGYLFDRSIELGCDSVIAMMSLVKEQSDTTNDEIDAAAKRSGYELVEAADGYRLYHLTAASTTSSFGVASKFRAIAIGDAAHTLALDFPAFEEADSTNLNDYTLEQLSSYDVIYLDGFAYSDKSAAEKMLLELSEKGVRVVIAADGIPADERTGSSTFLGLDCESITFKGGFPDFQTEDGAMATTLFPPDERDWTTVYVNGLNDAYATIEEDGHTLPVCGTGQNKNIVVVGLNLTYYESLTHDKGVASLLAKAMDVKQSELPERTVVPLQIEQNGRNITIESPADDVDTTIAMQDIFVAEQPVTARNNLMRVNKGTTVIHMEYPYLWQGLAVSIIGLLLAVAFFALLRRNEHKRAAEHELEINVDKPKGNW